MYRNVSLKMDKIFPKYYITYFGLCKFFNNGYLFSYDAVFLGHPVQLLHHRCQTVNWHPHLGWYKADVGDGGRCSEVCHQRFYCRYQQSRCLVRRDTEQESWQSWWWKVDHKILGFVVLQFINMKLRLFVFRFKFCFNWKGLLYASTGGLSRWL